MIPGGCEANPYDENALVRALRIINEGSLPQVGQLIEKPTDDDLARFV